MGDLLALGVDNHAHGDAGARHTFVQRTEVAGKPIRQHWDDAIREVCGIAAFAGLAVELGVWADVMGDVSDGDPDDVAAFVGRIIVVMRVAGVVVVAGIAGVDGDERQMRQIFPIRQIRRDHCVGFCDGCVWEVVRDTVLVDRDE